MDELEIMRSFPSGPVTVCKKPSRHHDKLEALNSDDSNSVLGFKGWVSVQLAGWEAGAEV